MDKQQYIVYKFLNSKNETLYIGKSVNFDNRIKSHIKTKKWWKEVKVVQIAQCSTKTDMDIYELYYINKLEPKYNIASVNNISSSFNLDELEFINYDFKNIISNMKKRKKTNYKISKIQDNNDNNNNIIINKSILNTIKQNTEINTDLICKIINNQLYHDSLTEMLSNMYFTKSGIYDIILDQYIFIGLTYDNFINMFFDILSNKNKHTIQYEMLMNGGHFSIRQVILKNKKNINIEDSFKQYIKRYKSDDDYILLNEYKTWKYILSVQEKDIQENYNTINILESDYDKVTQILNNNNIIYDEIK